MYKLNEETKEFLFDLYLEITSKTHELSDELFLSFIGTVMDERESFESQFPWKNPFKTVPALEELLEISRAIHEND